MTALVDTSVLVAVLQPSHHAHARAAAAWGRVRSGAVTAAVAAHALAETFRVLTAAPRTTPAQVAGVIRRLKAEIAPHCTVIPLSAADYEAVLDDLLARGLRGGVVYDALHVRAGLNAGATHVWTYNLRDFARLWPGPPETVTTPP